MVGLLGVCAAQTATAARREASGMGSAAGGPFCFGATRTRVLFARARGGEARTSATRVLRSDGTPADRCRTGGLSSRQFQQLLRKASRSTAFLSSLRGTVGLDVAGFGALRGLDGL